jgi:hypothetical protein
VAAAERLADMAEFRRRVTRLRQRAEDVRPRIPVMVFAVQPDGALLAAFAAAGADRYLLPLAYLGRSKTLAALDDWARLIPG